jgi:hypothetical protein
MSEIPERVTVPEAAHILNISEGAVRMRLNRGTLQSERDDNGRVMVLLHRENTERHEGEMTSLVESLQDQVGYLREQLDRERDASAELRRIVAGLVQRVPELEPAREPRESPVSAAEDEGRGQVPPEQEKPFTEEEPSQRSWWRRLFQ